MCSGKESEPPNRRYGEHENGSAPSIGG